MFPSAIKLLSSSNNGSRGFTPQTTPKMISLSEDILFVVDLGYLEPFLGIVLLTRRCETSGPMCLFRNVREALDTNVNIPPTPPPPPDDHTTTYATCASSMCNTLKNRKFQILYPFRKTSFLKFATLPRDRKWHISKSTTLPRAPYQPHAMNNLRNKYQFLAPMRCPGRFRFTRNSSCPTLIFTGSS